jgi:tRNA(Arg) A34 adenosine deaminase TadA
MTRPTTDQDPPIATRWVRALYAAHDVALAAAQAGHHPFGALLVGPDHTTVLATQGNVDAVNHAEAVLLRDAATRWSRETLWDCTLVTTVEPCAMCAGTQYWAHVGRVVYGLSEAQLRSITGDHADNPTLDLPCRDVFARGQKSVEVIGPLPTEHPLHRAIAQCHQQFWAR